MKSNSVKTFIIFSEEIDKNCVKNYVLQRFCSHLPQINELKAERVNFVMLKICICVVLFEEIIVIDRSHT